MTTFVVVVVVIQLLLLIDLNNNKIWKQKFSHNIKKQIFFFRVIVCDMCIYLWPKCISKWKWWHVWPFVFFLVLDNFNGHDSKCLCVCAVMWWWWWQRLWDQKKNHMQHVSHTGPFFFGPFFDFFSPPSFFCCYRESLTIFFFSSEPKTKLKFFSFFLNWKFLRF